LAVKYLAGERLIGTAAERGALNSNQPHWQILDRTILTSEGKPITVTGLDSKPFYQILWSVNNPSSGSGAPTLRMGVSSSVDSGSNYTYMYNRNSGTEAGTGTGWSTQFAGQQDPLGTNGNEFMIWHVANITGERKMGLGGDSNSGSARGAGYVPIRAELIGQWNNTGSLNTFSIHNDSSDDFGTDSEIVVLGYDPADTSGTPAWEQLATSNTLSSGVLNSGTFTAKKYLMWECRVVTAGTSHSLSTTFNSTGDTDEYNTRRNAEGGSDTSDEVNSDGILSSGTAGKCWFERGYVVNISGKEKIAMIHSVHTVTTENEDSSTAPKRNEVVGKWAHTSGQITSIQKKDFVSSGTDLSSGEITVWGFD